MDAVQKVIHQLEVGGGTRYLRIGLWVAAVLLLLGFYDLRVYHNLSTQEGMDSAQLARNIAQGKGYTTQFIRPLSLYLLSQRWQEMNGVPMFGSNPDQGLIRTNHPDIANPPVYPLLLAGLMKAGSLTKWTSFEYDLPSKPRPFWSIYGHFARYQPDFLIALFNQCLLLALVALVYLLARKLFDRNVAWLSGLLLLGTELLWRFSVSGLSTMLLLLVFVALIWCLVLLDQEASEPRWGTAALFGLAGLAGVLVGVGGLTRYSFGWLLVPTALFVVLFAGRQRIALAVTVCVAFAAVLSPWVVRNYAVCGKPFGVASYAAVEGTFLFPEHRLERSITPDFTRSLPLRGYVSKLLGNTRSIVQSDLPKLSGTWLSAFFLVGLLVTPRHPTASRLRVFLIAALLMLVAVQALGRTALTDDSPEINSENLLVLLTPLVVVYGVSLFYLLLEQAELPFRELRYVLLGGFCAIICLPLILVFLPPQASPLVYPPYHPPLIQKNVGDWTTPDELVMSDIPWAVAWYGQRQSVWLTVNSQNDFYQINDFMKPVRELYLSAVTLDARFQTQWMVTGEQTWGRFVLGCFGVKNEGRSGMPPGFPLWNIQPGWPDQFVLTFRDRPLRTETQ